MMDKVYLEACEREPLALSGAIQPHGGLLASDASGRVTHVSANLAEFIDQPAAALLGQPLPPALQAYAKALPPQPGSRCVGMLAVEGRDVALDLVASRGAKNDVCLFELTFSPAVTTPKLVDAARLQAPPADEGGVHAMRQSLVDQVARLTGAQRVLYYAFHADEHGEVIAEALAGGGSGSYLGLHFPASDIPRIARELYLKNPWRLIADASAAPVPLLAADDARPLDLTWSDLRSVSPVHQLYLANMGVRASLSFAVVIGGQLAALITAHHDQPFLLAPALLDEIGAQVRSHAFAMASWHSQRRMRMLDGLAYRFGELRLLLLRHGDLYSAWPELSAWLMQEFQVDGALLCENETALVKGQTFEEPALLAFDGWFLEQQDQFVWSGDSLPRQLPGYPLSEVAGVLALRAPFGDGDGLRLYLTRSEHIHEVNWGGNPDKPVEYHDGKFGIAPRRSFARWVERRLGYCRPWDNESRLLALKLRELLLEVLRA